ncbi:hybrid sensor histidine kinase/response regulator [uncultured Imperialibacter sp.]|uniref:sensor histidine kinase n=1 Tax=uncultured Imperialibacter sp. TaxID=1672639 RepID=UPI0030DB1DF6|tara:strand:- start:38262 stop:39401 length:1140 start_codon:yes stop_codon:yes gene_type:complete
MSKPSSLRILILEDFEEDADLLKINLRRQGVVFEDVVVDNRDDYVRQLTDFCPEVVLSDHQLPQFDSTEALQICREKTDNIPFILVTGTVSEEFAVLCIKQGADDYILKSNLTRLSSAIFSALNQREEERKRKEAEEILREQNKELTKLNGELDSFVYRVSHNLRAPLTSVLGLIQLSKLNGVSPSEIEKYLSLMEQSIVKLDHTVRGILDYSQNTRKALESEEVVFVTAIDESISNFRYMERFDAISIKKEIDQTTDFHSDTLRLAFIFDNLISNAIKFSKKRTEEPPFIRIGVKVGKEKAVIIVEDNGIGIEPEYTRKVFDMFFKMGESGAGLGLYIVKETVARLKGSIALSSEPDRGTTITIELPNQLQHSFEADQ